MYYRFPAARLSCPNHTIESPDVHWARGSEKSTAEHRKLRVNCFNTIRVHDLRYASKCISGHDRKHS